MFKINEIIYDNIKVNVNWGNFSVMSNNVKRSGLAPIIKFILNDEIYFKIETTIPKEWFINCSLNEKININKYICDLTYEDQNGWFTMIDQKYNCSIIKLNETNFKIIINIESEEFESMIFDIDIEIQML